MEIDREWESQGKKNWRRWWRRESKIGEEVREWRKYASIGQRKREGRKEGKKKGGRSERMHDNSVGVEVVYGRCKWCD